MGLTHHWGTVLGFQRGTTTFATLDTHVVSQNAQPKYAVPIREGLLTNERDEWPTHRSALFSVLLVIVVFAWAGVDKQSNRITGCLHRGS